MGQEREPGSGARRRTPGSDRYSTFGHLISGPHFDDPLPDEFLRAFGGDPMITREAPEQRVLLHNVGWETYGRLREEREERPAPRFFYDRGEMEIVSPSAEHESISGIIASLVKELAVALGIDVYGAGSTTFARQDLSGGFEPDEYFYFGEKAAVVRQMGRIDLDAGDPTPDLVVEVDLTSPSLAKLPVYARVGVHEVWRYSDGRLEILGLEESGEGYELLARSVVLGTEEKTLTAGELGRFVEEGSEANYPQWVRSVRRWAEGDGRGA